MIKSVISQYPNLIWFVLLPNRSRAPFKLDQCPTRTELYEKKLYEISFDVGGGPVAVLLWENSANLNTKMYRKETNSKRTLSVQQMRKSWKKGSWKNIIEGPALWLLIRVAVCGGGCAWHRDTWQWLLWHAVTGRSGRSDTAAAATAEMEHGDSELVARQQAECPGARTLSMEHTFYTHFQCHLGTVHLNQYCKEVFFQIGTFCATKWFDFAITKKFKG